jgi:hypothetical protein
MRARYRLTALVASKPRRANPPGVVPDHTGTVTQSTGRAAALAAPASASSRFEQQAKVESPIGGSTLQLTPEDGPRVRRPASPRNRPTDNQRRHRAANGNSAIRSRPARRCRTCSGHPREVAHAARGSMRRAGHDVPEDDVGELARGVSLLAPYVWPFPTTGIPKAHHGSQATVQLGAVLPVLLRLFAGARAGNRLPAPPP